MDNIIYIKNTKANATVLVREALEKIKKGVKNIIRFDKSVYRFYKEGCYTGVFYTSNNISGEKNVVFPVLDTDNLVIDGNGSEFIFCDIIYPFVIQNCRNVKLQNFSVDFGFVKYSQATVVSSDDQGFELMSEMFNDKSLLENAEKVKSKVIEQSFDGEYFIDNAVIDENNSLKLTDNRSETCQYYAYFTGVAGTDDIRFEKLTNKMFNVFGPERKRKGEMPEIAFSNAFIGNYLRLIILLNNKCFDKAVADVKGYFARMAELTGTLWEDDDLCKAKRGGSLNHGFASFAGVVLAFAVSGISEIDYKEKIIIIDKEYLSGINFSFKLNTDDGEIFVSEENGKKVVEIPANWA